MTDEQYHDLMEQMRDLGLMLLAGPVRDEKMLLTMMERLHRRADDSTPVTNLANAKENITYCITLLDFQDDPDGQVLRLCNLGFVVGALVKVITRSGDCIEVDLMGSKIAIRNEQAKAFSITKFPEQG